MAKTKTPRISKINVLTESFSSLTDNIVIDSTKNLQVDEITDVSGSGAPLFSAGVNLGSPSLEVPLKIFRDSVTGGFSSVKLTIGNGQTNEGNGSLVWSNSTANGSPSLKLSFDPKDNLNTAPLNLGSLTFTKSAGVNASTATLSASHGSLSINADGSVSTSGVLSVPSLTATIANLISASVSSLTSASATFTGSLSAAKISLPLIPKLNTSQNVNTWLNILQPIHDANANINKTSIAGTVSANNGSAVITGSGTSFLSELGPGDVVRINLVQYTIASISSNTSLTLATNYAGTTQSTLTLLKNNAVKASTYTGTGTLAGGGNYIGGAYSPSQNRIYFAPYFAGNQATWHYVDCNTGAITGYTSGGVASFGAYAGAVYSPTQNRIYFVPIGQTSTLHYIDCNTGSIATYSTSSINSYYGGVYSPTQNRIYFVPYNYSDFNIWQYVDCNTGNLVNYIGVAKNGASNLYAGGVYSPTQNRIYFVPSGISNMANWHYIDCSNGNVVSYSHGFGTSIVSGAYTGGVYSPTQNRIYFVPVGASNQSSWHYIDCSTGNVVAYSHGLSLGTSAYIGGCYSPAENRIYLTPYNQLNTWHYIDCNTGSVVPYAGVTSTVTNAYAGAVYSPSQNKIHFIPYSTTGTTFFLDIFAGWGTQQLPRNLFASTIISSTL